MWCATGTAVREAEEGTRVTLTCPPDGGSPARRWSTTHTGAITDQKGFHVSPADQTLTITSVEMNNSGLYSCDGKPVVYLHVTKGETQDVRDDEAICAEGKRTSQTAHPSAREPTF